jgi:hypothetical protein
MSFLNAAHAVTEAGKLNRAFAAPFVVESRRSRRIRNRGAVLTV